jgi:hypothetical protein
MDRIVAPTQAGIQFCIVSVSSNLDPGLRRDGV